MSDGIPPTERSRTMPYRILFAFFCGFSLVSMLHADTLYLRDGGQADGTYLGGDSRTVRFLTENGRVERFSIAEVESVVFTGGQAAGSSSFSPLSSTMGSFGDSDFGATAVGAGARLVVRTIDNIDSDIHRPGDTFQATLDEPLMAEQRVVVKRGAPVTVQLVHVKQSGRIRGKEEIALQLRSITVNNRSYPLATDFATRASSGKGGETAKAATGAGVVGAIIGTITGGARGAAVGAASGAGGATVIRAIRGKRVRVPSESRLSFTLEEALTLG